LIKCVVLGAGLIGQQFVRLLENHPYFELTKIIASDKSKNQSLKNKWRLPSFNVPTKFADMPMTSYDSLDPSTFEVVFSALPASMATKIETDLAHQGKAVFSNASAHRYDNNVPILIPEINAEHIKVIEHQESFQHKGFIITNSNCTVSGLALFLHAVRQLQSYIIKNVYISSYQALSGAGFQGLESLARDTVIPYIPQEEEKVTKEARKILGSVNNNKINEESTIHEILATCARVPIIDGHLEAITIEFDSIIDSETILRHLRSLKNTLSLPTAPPKYLKLHKDFNRPQASLDLYDDNDGRASGMTVNISPIRFSRRHLRCFLLVHNTIRGGAGGSVLNAELAHSLKYI